MAVQELQNTERSHGMGENIMIKSKVRTKGEFENYISIRIVELMAISVILIGVIELIKYQ